MPSGTLPVKIINNDGTLWAICKNGAVWRFNNEVWSLVSSGGGNKLYTNYGIGADFIDMNNGVIVAYAGEDAKGNVLKLENGNWSYGQSISDAQFFASVSLYGNTDTGWAGAKRYNKSEGSKAFGKMTDGKWILSDDISLNYNDRIRAVALIDENNGWAAGSLYDSESHVYNDTFWKLSNGVWTQEAKFTTNSRPSFIRLNDASNGWATGKDGTKWLLQGGTWTKSADREGISEVADLDDDKVMFYPIDENNGWETYYLSEGTNGIHLLKLVNNKWENIEDGIYIVGSPVTAWAFEDMDTGWIAVCNVIYKVVEGKVQKYGVDDYGNLTVETSVDDYIYKIWIQDYKNGWAIANNMTIYKLMPNESQ